MRIHEQKLKVKKHELQQKVCDINPLNSCEEDIEPLVSQLENKIIQWNRSKGEVIGGVLFQFTVQNYSKSEQHCEELLRELVKLTKVNEKVTEAVQNSKTLNIKREIEKITYHYNGSAIGPAKETVLKKGHKELNQLGDTLKMIPGCPQGVKIIGTGSDRIKLSWNPPAHNPEAAELYVVSMRDEDGVWKEVKRTKHTKALVTGLKSKKKYEFKVTAANATLVSLANKNESETERSKTFFAGLGFAVGVVCAPFATVGMLTCAAVDGIKYGSKTTTTTSVEEVKDKPTFKLSTTTILGITAATMPLSLLLSPVTVPLMATGTTIAAVIGSTKGDVTPVSEGGD